MALKFKLKDQNSGDASAETITIVDEATKSNPIDAEKNLENKAESEVRRKKVSSYFYQVNDHPNLTKVGESFYKDITKGLKSFAIASTGYAESQQKTILALASFFDHKEQFKILIVSNNLEFGVYKEFIENSEELKFCEQTDDKPEIKFHRFHDHFDFISFYSIFLYTESDGPNLSLEDGLKKIISKYDVILWDLPSLGEIQSKGKYFFPIMSKFDSLTIVVAQNLSQYSDLEDVKQYFSNYGVNLKGLLIDTSKITKKNFGASSGK